MSNKLSDKQEQFCKEYLIDLNQTQAAVRAGYSERTAKSQSSRLLTNVNIQSRIQELMDKRSKRTEITADRVLQELAKIGFANIQDFFDNKGNIKDLDQMNHSEVVSEISTTVSKTGEVTKKLKLYDKLKGLELIGRNLAMFTDKIENKTDEGQFNQVVNILKINHRSKGEQIESQKEEENEN